MDTKGEWVTVAIAAERLGKSERTIRRWVASGKIDSDRTTPALRVDIAGRVPAHAEPTPDAAGEIAGLRGEIERLIALLVATEAERARVWHALGLALSGDRPMLTERATSPRRRWRWPWQRGER